MKTRKPSAALTAKPLAIGHAIEERVKQQPDQRRCADRGVHLVGFFAEVEVSCERVLRQVNEHIARERGERCTAPVPRDRLGQKLPE